MSCELDDPEATSFQLFYPGMSYSCSHLDFDSRLMADRTMNAIDAAFAAGKSAAFAELRRLIGTKDA